MGYFQVVTEWGYQTILANFKKKKKKKKKWHENNCSEGTGSKVDGPIECAECLFQC